MKNRRRIIASHVVNLTKNFLAVKLSRKKNLLCKQAFSEKWYCPSKPLKKSIKPVITWIGQATFLIQVGNANILTDPIFTSPSMLVPRILPPGIAIKNLPKIDVILISHNHPDHMEKKALLKLKSHNPQILVPEGNGKWFAKNGFDNVTECNWGDKKTFNESTFTFLPAKHWSGNTIFNINKSKHGSWMIQHDTDTIYFAGDTSYDNHFLEIAQDFKSIQTALLPIAPVEPRHLVDHAHIDGKQAVQAFVDLNAKNLVPMHWGTFRMGVEIFDEPITLLKKHWEQRELTDKNLFVLKFGKSENII